MKTERMSIKEFMNKKESVEEPFALKAKRHFEKYGKIYQVAGVTVILLLSSHGMAFASTGIDIGARKFYYELVNLGKWVIIFKGGVDTIKAVANEDMDKAKKSFFSHLLIYLMLLALPYGMDKVDEVFQGVTKA